MLKDTATLLRKDHRNSGGGKQWDIQKIAPTTTGSDADEVNNVRGTNTNPEVNQSFETNEVLEDDLESSGKTDTSENSDYGADDWTPDSSSDSNRHSHGNSVVKEGKLGIKVQVGQIQHSNGDSKTDEEEEGKDKEIGRPGGEESEEEEVEGREDDEQESVLVPQFVPC
jgi:hypothetical protein